LRNSDDRTHPYATTKGCRPFIQGNIKQVRQALEARKEGRGAGGDNERGLGYIPRGFNARVAKPSQQQFDQWRQEEPDLLRRLHGGDYAAAAILAERYRWWLGVQVASAVERVSGGLRFEDVFDAALIQFLESLKDYRPGSNNGLRAYLDKAIAGAISDAQQEWQRHGFTGLDTRLRRFLRNEAHRSWPLEAIQKLFPNYTLEQIAEAKKPFIMQSYGEGAVDDGNGFPDENDSGHAIAAASHDPINAVSIRSSASEGSKRDSLGRRWPRRVNERNVVGYESSGVRGGIAHGEYGRRVEKWSYRRDRTYAPLWNDLVEHYTVAGEETLLQQMGRQAFTEWRMEHRFTANTGEWDDGEWRSTERRQRSRRSVSKQPYPLPVAMRVDLSMRADLQAPKRVHEDWRPQSGYFNHWSPLPALEGQEADSAWNRCSLVTVTEFGERKVVKWPFNSSVNGIGIQTVTESADQTAIEVTQLEQRACTSSSTVRESQISKLKETA
jgi:hypothetical protein